MDEDSDDVDFVSLGSSARELEAMGYSSTDSECSRDGCAGKKWYNDHNIICAACSTVVDTTTRVTMTRLDSPWERFNDGDRPTYWHSGRTRMVGGFGSCYDKVDDDETLEEPTPRTRPHPGPPGDIS